MEWDVDDRINFQDYRDEARRDRHEEARRNAQEDEFEKRALHCGACGFSWTPGWSPRDPIADQKYSDASAAGRCPVCGSKRKA